MREYIKREDAQRALVHTLKDAEIDNACNEQDWYCQGLTDAGVAIDAVPSADVVEVVRCKDCKWWKAKPNEDEEDNESNGFATWYDGNKLCHICGNGNDFCSYGKRKDNE